MHVLRYIGGGRWIAGVPARDIEVGVDVDAAEAPALIASGLYEDDGQDNESSGAVSLVDGD